MMPSNEVFIEWMKKLRIRKDDLIICYDHLGCFGSPRAWLTFLTFNAKNVKVLNGGLQAWKNRGHPTVTNGKGDGFELLDPDKSDSYSYLKQEQKVLGLKEVYELVKKVAANPGSHFIIDARPNARFIGAVEEPRAGLRRGCIPGSINIPFQDMLENMHMKKLEVLKSIFAEKGVDLAKPVTATCGSGMTACIILLALYRLGVRDQTLYDGSWAEYV